MGRLGDFARSLKPGNDQALAADLNAKASRSRRAGHKARVIRDGDASGTKVPRHLRRHNGG